MGEGLGLPPGVNAQPVLGMMSKSLLSFIDEQESFFLSFVQAMGKGKVPPSPGINAQPVLGKLGCATPRCFRMDYA